MTNENNTTANTTPKSTGDSGFFRALISYYIHQDQLMWSRTQILIATQGGFLAGSYSLIGKNDWVAFLMPLSAALFTLLLSAVIKLDMSDRDVNLKLMDKIAEELSNPYVGNNIPRFRLTSERKWSTIRGRFVLLVVICLLLLSDITMSFLIFVFHILPTSCG
jgi:hypothetical protein